MMVYASKLMHVNWMYIIGMQVLLSSLGYRHFCGITSIWHFGYVIIYPGPSRSLVNNELILHDM